MPEIAYVPLTNDDHKCFCGRWHHPLVEVQYEGVRYKLASLYCQECAQRMIDYRDPHNPRRRHRLVERLRFCDWWDGEKWTWHDTSTLAATS